MGKLGPRLSDPVWETLVSHPAFQWLVKWVTRLKQWEPVEAPESYSALAAWWAVVVGLISDEGR